MRTLALVALACTFSSCVVVHVHESPAEPRVDVGEAPRTDARSVGRDQPNGTVHGIVVDAAGKPVQARVALVSANGSMSTTTNAAGEFGMEPQFGTRDLVVHASTEDGRVAILPTPTGGGKLELVLAPGGTITIDFTAEQNMRCAVFQGDLRIEDFTLRAKSHRTRVVVPVGDIHVQVYGGGKSPSGGPGITSDERVTIARGETKNLAFAIDPTWF